MFFPHFSKIRHVVLENVRGFEFISRNIPKLQHLQTLFIGHEAYYEPEEIKGKLRLQLTHLTALRSLAFEIDVMPHDIALPAQCGLHEVFNWRAGLPRPVLGPVLPYLQSLNLSQGYNAPQSLPNAVEQATNLTRLSLFGFRVGTRQAPVRLRGMWAKLEHLSLQDAAVHAIIPTGVAWRTCRVHASGTFSISFEDAGSFARDVGALCFEYDTAKGDAMEHLAVLLKSRQPDWHGLISLGTEPHPRTKLCYPELPAASPAYYVTWHFCPCAACRIDCKCGACRLCLEEAGILERLDWPNYI